MKRKTRTNGDDYVATCNSGKSLTVDSIGGLILFTGSNFWYSGPNWFKFRYKFKAAFPEGRMYGITLVTCKACADVYFCDQVMLVMVWYDIILYKSFESLWLHKRNKQSIIERRLCKLRIRIYLANIMTAKKQFSVLSDCFKNFQSVSPVNTSAFSIENLEDKLWRMLKE